MPYCQAASLLERNDDGIYIIRHDDTGPFKEYNDNYVNYPVFSFDEKRCSNHIELSSSQTGCCLHNRIYMEPKSISLFFQDSLKSLLAIAFSADEI